MINRIRRNLALSNTVKTKTNLRKDIDRLASTKMAMLSEINVIEQEMNIASSKLSRRLKGLKDDSFLEDMASNQTSHDNYRVISSYQFYDACKLADTNRKLKQDLEDWDVKHKQELTETLKTRNTERNFLYAGLVITLSILAFKSIVGAM